MVKKVSLFDRLLNIMWWVLPFLFGILGGAISYIAVGMAQGKPKEGKIMLGIGLVMSLIGGFLYFIGILSFVSIVMGWQIVVEIFKFF